MALLESNHNENFWIVIPAAGIGARFNHSKPKQYISIQGKTVLEHSIDIFLSLEWVKKIIIPLSAKDHYFASLSVANHPKIVVVAGGETRTHSVQNALRYLNAFASLNDWVLTHDAVRPCLHSDDLQRLRQMLKNDAVGGILASPVSDTLKLGSDNNIVRTVDRTDLWGASTPQMFRFQLLAKALNNCLENGVSLTDDASALEHIGLPVKMVPALYPNPKLTYAADLQYLRYLLSHTIVEKE